MEKVLGISMTTKQMKTALTVSLIVNAAFIARELGIFDVFKAIGFTKDEEVAAA